MSSDKHRASYLTVLQQYNLNTACKQLRMLGYGTYHVGSSLTKPDYHDVDLRCILPDVDFDRLFGPGHHGNGLYGENFRLFLNAAISEWIVQRTGLPIDFQFQKQSEANEKYKGQGRNAVGH